MHGGMSAPPMFQLQLEGQTVNIVSQKGDTVGKFELDPHSDTGFKDLPSELKGILETAKISKD